jgi:hypothetical protein
MGPVLRYFEAPGLALNLVPEQLVLQALRPWWFLAGP